ncbi:MAG: hypothetical protein HGB05_13850 [Chloroflexi bacterium]|nr:hypothetical protein [Chloroflexota bacterium]
MGGETAAYLDASKGTILIVLLNYTLSDVLGSVNVIKDNTAAGTLRLYEPEITDTGRHLISLSANGAELNDYLDADSTNGIYEYIQLMGRVIPSRSPFTSGTTP